MSIKSILKSTVVALTIPRPVGRFSHRALPSMQRPMTRWLRRGLWPMRRPSHRAPGPARSNRLARCASAARKLRIASLLNEKDGKIRGFDLGLAQLITRYILGDAAKYQFTQR